MAVLNNAPFPQSDPIASPQRDEYRAKRERDPKEGLITQPWIDYYSSQTQLMESFPSRVFSVQLTGQKTSLGATDMTDGTLSAGLYRLSFYARITTAAAISSSLTVAFDWQDGGLTQTYTNVAVTGNTTTTFQGNPTLTFRIDSQSPVRYSTTYASDLVGQMEYCLYINLEEVNA